MLTLENTATAAYVVAALLFILALAGLSKHETSKAGSSFGIAGMAVALIATIALALARDIEPLGLALLIVAMVIGAVIGLWRAKIVEMTGMPELIALLHSFVGLAAVLVGWGMTWANQNAKICANRSDIESLKREVSSVSDQAGESEKAIVRMETKIEYIIKGVDEIKAEVKSK